MQDRFVGLQNHKNQSYVIIFTDERHGTGHYYDSGFPTDYPVPNVQDRLLDGSEHPEENIFSPAPCSVLLWRYLRRFVIGLRILLLDPMRE